MKIPATARLTFDDFCMLVKDGQKGDLINGAIYLTAPDSTDANELTVWLLSIVYPYVETRDLGCVFGFRVAFVFDEENSPEPDIAFVPKDRFNCVQASAVYGAPDLAIEIVSPDTIQRDYELKRQQYQSAGVIEYWIVDELQHKQTFLRLGRDGVYRQVRPRQGVFTSKAIPGFWLRPEWLWQEPRPHTLDILQQLLS